MFLILFSKGGLDLEFHPRASNGMLREHQQQLVIQANGLIDALPDFVTRLHVFRGKPTAHAFALQVGIEPFGKRLVTAGIANKAGVVLDGMSNQGVYIGEEVIWHTGLAQKCFGNMSLRTIDGINANARWASVLYRLQSSHGAQIEIIELCPLDCSTAEVGAAEVGTAEVSASEVGTAEVSTAEVSTAEVGVAEGGSAEVGTAEIGLVEVGSAEVGTAEVGLVEVGTAEVGIKKGGLAEVGKAEVGTAEVSASEVGTTEVGTAEVGMAEIRSYLWMLLFPGIPSVPSLPEHVKLVLICHVIHLLCSALIIERCGCVCKHCSLCFFIGDGRHLALVAKCRCSLGHDTGKPCLSKYMVAWWC